VRSYGPSHRVAASSSAFVEDAAARNFAQMGRVLGSVDYEPRRLVSAGDILRLLAS
jgi:hypothetical protein